MTSLQYIYIQYIQINVYTYIYIYMKYTPGPGCIPGNSKWFETGHFSFLDDFLTDTYLMPQSVVSHRMTRRMTMRRRTRTNVWHQRPINWLENSRFVECKCVIHRSKNAMSISICLKQVSDSLISFKSWFILKTLTSVHVGSVCRCFTKRNHRLCGFISNLKSLEHLFSSCKGKH